MSAKKPPEFFRRLHKFRAMLMQPEAQSFQNFAKTSS